MRRVVRLCYQRAWPSMLTSPKRRRVTLFRLEKKVCSGPGQLVSDVIELTCEVLTIFRSGHRMFCVGDDAQLQIIMSSKSDTNDSESHAC